MILVMAVNKIHFEHWCREVGLNPNNNNSVRYVFSPNQLRGIIGRVDIEIITLPGWYQQKDESVFSELDALVKEHYKRRTR